jgi:hypothetical protein
MKQAETALADGRLEEALELVKLEQFRTHRHGQDLIARLLRAFLDRAEEHLRLGRAEAALQDCDRATRLGGNAGEIAELRGRAVGVVQARQKELKITGQVVAMARAHAQGGRLATGEQLLGDACADDSRVVALHQELLGLRAQLENKLKLAEFAITREDWEAAADAVADARGIDSVDQRVIEAATKVATALRRNASSALNDGRLVAASSFLERLSQVDSSSSESQQLQRAMSECRGILSMVEQGRLHEAEEAARRLRTILPDARWLQETLSQLSAMCEGLDRFRAGPLGLLRPPRRTLDGVTTVGPAANARVHRPAPAAPAVSAREEPDRFIIQVDGAGSYLVLGKDRVRVGAVSSSDPVDCGLITEPGLPPANIDRTDDDYFIRCSGPMLINDKPCNGKLLVSGDRVSLSPRCRFTFQVPNAASTTAVLDLNGARYPRSDVRRVILLDRDIVLGPGHATHIRCEHVPECLVLTWRGGKLHADGQSVQVDGDRFLPPGDGIPVGMPVRVGNISFVVTKA